jgi:hypothetical protein
MYKGDKNEMKKIFFNMGAKALLLEAKILLVDIVRYLISFYKNFTQMDDEEDIMLLWALNQTGMNYFILIFV